MKKLVLLTMIVFSVVACDNSGKVETKAESLKVKLDTTLEKISDSAEAKGKRTLDVLKRKVQEIRDKKDTARQDSVN